MEVNIALLNHHNFQLASELQYLIFQVLFAQAKCYGDSIADQAYVIKHKGA